MLILRSDVWYQPINGGYKKRVKGDALTVDDSTSAWLIKCGIAVDDSILADQTKEDKEVSQAPEPVSEPEPETTKESEVITSSPSVDLPAKSAPKRNWVTVAKKLGISTTGLSKPEIISAVMGSVSN